MDDNNDVLDGFLSDAPAPAVAEIINDEGQPRAPDGKFASKEPEPQPVEPIDTAAQAVIEGAQPPAAMVPQQALHAARQGEKEAREQAADLQRQLQQLTGQVQLLSQQRQQPVTPQEQSKPKDFWESPEDFVQSALTPVQQQMQQQMERMSRTIAIQTHGRETVDAAYQAMGNALHTDPRARFDYQRIMSSDHPYDELVTWHKRAETLNRIGENPDAYVDAELERRLTDPAHAAKIMERMQAIAAGANRPGQAPVTQLPPSLNRIPGGANAASGAVDSEGLFNTVTDGMR